MAAMENASSLASALGRKNMMEALGVKATAISNAVVRNRFPAAWFITCQKLAQDAGVECPPDLFGFGIRKRKAS